MSDPGIDPQSSTQAPPLPESSAPLATPLAEAQASGGGASQANAIHTVATGRDANFIQQQKIVQIEKLVGSYVEEELLSTERKFTAADASPLHDRLEQELIHTSVVDESLFAKMLHRLEESRILLLTGDPDIGKRTIALYLGFRIAENQALVVDSLERRISIDLAELAGDREQFGRRATVFIDVFEQNRQLRSFFENGNSIRWTKVIDSLRDNGSYLIFTSSTLKARLHQSLAAQIPRYELQPLPPEKIWDGIEQHIAWMASHEEIVAERLAILSGQRTRIAEELKTLPRISAFVKQFVRDDTDLDTSLRRARDVRYWSRTVLDRDAGAWVFVLSLLLAQSTRNAQGASWADFERLRRAILDRIRSDAEFIVRRNSKAEAVEDAERAVVPSFSDDVLLERCRATVVKDLERLGDIVKFEHPSLLPELWQTLLSHHRRALMAVLPLLTSIAEESDYWSMRVLAAQAIGRLGEIDPRRIAIPLIQRWSSSDDRIKRPLVGRMIQGVLGSANENYQNFMLEQIRLLAEEAASEDPGETSNSLLTAIGAYSQIGVYDADLAMEELGKIVTNFLAPIVADVQSLGRAVETVDSILSETTSKRAARGLMHRRIRLTHVADRLLEAQAPAMVAIEQTVVLLCRVHDPVQILRKMRDWSSRGGSATATLVALLFLYDGIAADLEGLPFVSLASDREAVHHFCGFLADVYESITGTFKITADLQRELQEKFNDCLISWVRLGTADADLRPAVIALFVGLAEARGRTMERNILLLLEENTFSDERSMQLLANEIRGRLKPATGSR